MGRRKTTYADFLRRARKVHGARYAYPVELEFFGSHTIIPVTCATHGVFMQKASSHTTGCGCPTCARIASQLALTLANKPKPRAVRAPKAPPPPKPFGALGGLYKLPFWN